MITNSISNCAIQEEIRSNILEDKSLIDYNKQKQMGILYLWEDTG